MEMVNLFPVSKSRDTSTIIFVWKFYLQDDYQQEGKFFNIEYFTSLWRWNWRYTVTITWKK